LEAEIRRNMAQGQPRKKVNKTSISTNKPGMKEHVHNPSYMGGVGRRIGV
jgi:hypothetical protein